MRKGRSFSTFGIAALCLFVAFALLMGTDPAWFRNLRDTIRARMEGWSVVKQGDFRPLALRMVDKNYRNPEEFGTITGMSFFQTGAIFYFSCPTPVPSIEPYELKDGVKPDSYAKLVTPKGSELFVSISRCAKDHIYAVQIPAVHAPETEFLELQIHSKGLTDTVVKVDKLPPSVDTVPKSGPVVDKMRDGDITVSGKAFTAVAEGSAQPVGIGYRLELVKPDNGLDWRLALYESSLEPFASQDARVPEGAFNTSMIGNRNTIGTVRGVPYSAEIEKLGVRARLDGYETHSETVDFGNMRFFPDLAYKSSTGEPHYFLDFTKPITKALPSGLKVTLLPLRSQSELNSSLGNSSLYFRLKVEPDPLQAWMEKEGLKQGEAIVEAKLLGTDNYYNAISPEPNGNPVSNVVMLWWTPPAAKELSVKFEVRRNLLRRRVSIALRLPVDHQHPRTTTAVKGNYLMSGSEYFD